MDAVKIALINVHLQQIQERLLNISELVQEKPRSKSLYTKKAPAKTANNKLQRVKQLPQAEKWISSEEAGKMLHLTKAGVRYQVKTGRLHGILFQEAKGGPYKLYVVKAETVNFVKQRKK